MRLAEFGGDTWYNNDRPDYAIDGQNALVMSTADTIATSLPEGSTDNAYAFARATFDYLHTYVSYDHEAIRTTSLRTDLFGGWYAIAMNRPTPISASFELVAFPVGTPLAFLETRIFQPMDELLGATSNFLSETLYEDRNIVLQTCFVEAQADVVNNKWLLSTPTAYIDWVEQADPPGEAVYDYYHPFDRSWGPTDPVQKMGPKRLIRSN